jgi:hypothetical protein
MRKNHKNKENIMLLLLKCTKFDYISGVGTGTMGEVKIIGIVKNSQT